MHYIFINKDKVFTVRCIGDYSDLVPFKPTTYEFSKVFSTLEKARAYAVKEQAKLNKEYHKLNRKTTLKIKEEI